MFKDKLRNERDNYQIKLTSDDILNKFHEEKITKKSFNYKPLLAFSMSLAILVTSTVIYLNNNNNNSNVKNKFANILSLEVASSLDFIDNYNTLNLNMLKKRNNLDDSTFNDICNNFVNNYNTLKTSLEYKENYEFEIKEDSFNINNSIYTYRVTLKENKYLYFNIDSNSNDNINKERYNGILESNDNYYKMIGVRKVNSNNKKDEINIKIEISNKSYITIEQETERSESSYSYSIFENNKEVYEMEIDFEKDEIEMECSENNKEYEYEIEKKKDYYSIQYSYEYHEDELEGLMTLTIENNKFSFEDKKNEKYLEIYQ